MSSHEDYLKKLDQHSHASRYDPLRDAVRRVLVAWDHRYDSSDLPEAMEKLRYTLQSVQRGGEEDVPEVEVTHDRSPVHVEAPERPPERRRSAAKNLSDPIYQNAFIEGARAAMGQPSADGARSYLGERVTLIFNVDWQPATGVLTDVVNHPAGAGPSLVLDNYRERVYPLNAVQEIRSAG